MTLYTFKYIALHICLQHTFYINTMYKYNINALDSNTFYDLTSCIKNKKGQFFTITKMNPTLKILYLYT